MKTKLFLALATVLLLASAGRSVYAVSGLTVPVHFDDTIWNLSSSAGYNDLATDINVKVLNGQGDAYYYSLSPYFTNGTNVYAGLQTNGYNGSAYVGKMLIFSVWNVSSGLAEPGGNGTTFGGEGAGYSVRLPYNWSVGTTYRLKIYIDQDAASGNRLWGASITNLSSGQTQRIGRIYVPVTYGKIYSPITFHERYMGSTQSCSDISGSQVSFTNVSANAGSLTATSWNHYAVASIPACSATVWLQDITGGYLSTAGIAHPAAPVAVAPSAPVAKKVAPAPAATPTPAPVVTPALTNQPSALDTQATKSTATPAKSLSVWKKVLAVVLTAALGGALVFVALMHRRLRKIRRAIAEHFPHDFDIHGPKD